MRSTSARARSSTNWICFVRSSASQPTTVTSAERDCPGRSSRRPPPSRNSGSRVGTGLGPVLTFALKTRPCLEALVPPPRTGAHSFLHLTHLRRDRVGVRLCRSYGNEERPHILLHRLSLPFADLARRRRQPQEICKPLGAVFHQLASRDRL